MAVGPVKFPWFSQTPSVNFPWNLAHFKNTTMKLRIFSRELGWSLHICELWLNGMSYVLLDTNRKTLHQEFSGTIFNHLPWAITWDVGPTFATMAHFRILLRHLRVVSGMTRYLWSVESDHCKLITLITAVWLPQPIKAHFIMLLWPTVNPLIAILKPQSDWPSYSNTVIGTLAVDWCWWAVTFGTARRGLGGATARPVPSSLYQM